MMRAASGLLVAVLLSTCAISGTFAKYTTSADGSDSARVAKWGFQPTTINLDDLFKNAYDTTVNSSTDVIAPGTTGSTTFGFTYGGDGAAAAPEVAYTFNVSTDGSSCDQSIQNNANILWNLDGGQWGTWTDLLTSIEALEGNQTEYGPNTLPAAFNNPGNNNHTVSWKWIFDEKASNIENGTVNNDVTDTVMGNADKLGEVKLKITITATQID